MKINLSLAYLPIYLPLSARPWILTLFLMLMAAPVSAQVAKDAYTAYRNEMAIEGKRLLFLGEVLKAPQPAKVEFSELAIKDALFEQELDAKMLFWVNKNFLLPYPLAPSDLRQIAPEWTARPEQAYHLRATAHDALMELLETGMAASGERILVLSAYRSFNTQVDTFAYWVKLLGLEQAERESARPGHSEHQLGTVVDLTTSTLGTDPWQLFGPSAAGQWVAEHAHEFGFTVSYQDHKEHVTGYIPEPWHIRYVGKEAAGLIFSAGLTLEEAFQAVYVRNPRVKWGLPQEVNAACKESSYYDSQLWTCNKEGTALQRCRANGKIDIWPCAIGCAACPFGTSDSCRYPSPANDEACLEQETDTTGAERCGADGGSLIRCQGPSAEIRQCGQRRCVASGRADKPDFFE